MIMNYSGFLVIFLCLNFVIAEAQHCSFDRNKEKRIAQVKCSEDYQSLHLAYFDTTSEKKMCKDMCDCPSNTLPMCVWHHTNNRGVEVPTRCGCVPNY